MTYVAYLDAYELHLGGDIFFNNFIGEYVGFALYLYDKGWLLFKSTIVCLC